MAGLQTDSWVDMQVRNHLSSNDDLTFANAHHDSGEFVDSISTPTEISNDDINSLVAKPRHLTHIVACNQSGDSAGTSGGYDIFDGSKKVCHVSWSCPLGRGVTNALDIADLADSYEVECKGASLQPGPLGHVSISVSDTRSI